MASRIVGAGGARVVNSSVRESVEPRKGTDLDELISMATELYQGLETVGDQLEAVGDRIMGGTVRVAGDDGNTPRGDTLSPPKLFDLRERLARGLRALNQLRTTADRLDGAL